MGKPFGSMVSLPKLNAGISPPTGFLNIFSKRDRLYTRVPGATTDMAVDGVIATKNASDQPNSYPFGTTMFGVGTTVSVPAGWPADTEASMVVTFRASKDPMTGNDYEFVTQRCMSRTSGKTWFRTATSGTAWSSWIAQGLDVAQPYSKRYRSNNLSLPNNSATNVNFGTSVEGTNITWTQDGGSDWGWEVNRAGLYVITVQVSWERNTTNRRELRLRVNGTQVAQNGLPGAALDSNDNGHALTYIQRLAVGDFVKAEVYQNSTTSLNIMGGSTLTYGAIARVSA